MINVTKEQKSFLIKHNIDFNLIFDAQGLRRGEYQKKMKLLGKKVAINVTSCRNGGHTMRDKSGHCLQCNPQYLSFSKNYNANDYVYIAFSKKEQIFKVGSTREIDMRESYLNNNKYAGLNDWEMLYYFQCEMSGKVERLIHKELVVYKHQIKYNYYGTEMVSEETFKCNFFIIKNIIAAMGYDDLLNN